MADNLTPEDRLKTMRAVKSQKTGPERRFRAMLAGLGLKGWKINPLDVEGSPDIVFPNEKIAIFIDGCFWHSCPICNRPLPVSNREYWAKKIHRNAERDKKNTFILEELGWTVFRIWEHELGSKNGLSEITQKLLAILQLEANVRRKRL